MRGLFQVLQLILALQGFDEGFLRQVLRVVHVADNAVDQKEDAALVVLHKAVLKFRGQRNCVESSAGCFLHGYAVT